MLHNDHEAGSPTLEHAAHGKLEAFMSAVSQAVYSTSWFTNLEYLLWEALDRGDPHPFTAQQVLELRALSEASRSWIRRDDGKGRPLPLDEWRSHYKKQKNKNRKNESR
jgi:hypothetical protein